MGKTAKRDKNGSTSERNWTDLQDKIGRTALRVEIILQSQISKRNIPDFSRKAKQHFRFTIIGLMH